MDELRKNHILQMRTRNNDKINGIVVDYLSDRIMVLISRESINLAKNLEELDELLVLAHTHLGLKKMFSCVISKMDVNNCIIIENCSSVPIEQKREHVRVLSSVNFKIEKNGEVFNCVCINISAGGVAFYSNEGSFRIDDCVIIKFSKSDFGKDITIEAKIIKLDSDGEYVAIYLNLDTHDRDKIVKYVFSLIAQK